MPSTLEIIRQAGSLLVEERPFVVDSLLQTLHPPDAEMERKWVAVAKRRLAELRTGCVKPVPGDEVFARVRERRDFAFCIVSIEMAVKQE